jgi:hypothetical protein
LRFPFFFFLFFSTFDSFLISYSLFILYNGTQPAASQGLGLPACRCNPLSGGCNAMQRRQVPCSAPAKQLQFETKGGRDDFFNQSRPRLYHQKKNKESYRQLLILPLYPARFISSSSRLERT